MINLCRNCEYWQPTQQWRGNCRKHPWEQDKYSDVATVYGCKDYVDKHAKYQVAAKKEA